MVQPKLIKEKAPNLMFTVQVVPQHKRTPGPHSQVAASNTAQGRINAGHPISGKRLVQAAASFNRSVGSPIPIARHSTRSRFDSSQDSSPNKPLELSYSPSLVTSLTM